MKRKAGHKISKNAVVKNTTFDSGDVRVEYGAKLTDVHIKAKKVVIKSNAVLTECKLFSEGEITIGHDSTIKERVVMNAFRGITIGDRTVIDRDVFVGGTQSEKSELRVGDDSAVLYRSYLNTTRRILIGSNTGIGGYAKIFTHSSWPNALKGNPYKFGDVVIKDDVWIAWDIIIMPGIVIEEGTTVGSGAVVTRSLPPSVVAVGVPAKIVSTKENQELPMEEKHKIVLEMLEDFSGYANGFLGRKNTTSHNKDSYSIEFDNGKRLNYFPNAIGKLKPKDVIISFKIPSEVKRKNEWIEFDTTTTNAKADVAQNFISFIRRYGIRIRQFE